MRLGVRLKNWRCKENHDGWKRKLIITKNRFIVSHLLVAFSCTCSLCNLSTCSSIFPISLSLSRVVNVGGIWMGEKTRGVITNMKKRNWLTLLLLSRLSRLSGLVRITKKAYEET